MAFERVEVAGVPVDLIDMEESVALITAAARARQHFQVSTVNLDFLVNAQSDADVHAILRSNALNVADGAPVVWLGRLAGASVKERVPGADLVPRLAAVAAEEHLRVFLLGGQEGAAETAAGRLRERHPELDVHAYEPAHASLEDIDDATIFEHLESAMPHLLLVAFGHPKQEKWISNHRCRLPMVAMGVGCSLDLIAGRTSRAPSWMQRLGLEWAYRLAREPGRLARRYLRDGCWLASALPRATVARRPSRPDHGVSVASAVYSTSGGGRR